MRGWEERGPALFQVQREFQGLGFRVQDGVWGLVFFDVDISTRIFTISDTNLPKKKEHGGVGECEVGCLGCVRINHAC